jgi:hypothetical protein
MNLVVSDKLQEALIKSVSIKPAKRGGSIKPGGEAQRNPRIIGGKEKEPT